MPSFHPVIYTDTTDITLLQIPQFLLFAVTGTCFVIMQAKKMTKNNLLEYFGCHSLVVYAMHFPILLCIIRMAAIVYTPQGKIDALVMLAIICMVQWTLCYMVIWPFSKRPLRWMTGKF